MVMEKFVFEGKSEEDALENAKAELMVNNDEIFYNVLSEEKGGLFKSKKVSVEVTKKTTVVEFIKGYIKEVTKLMGIDANLETRERDGNLSITIYSDNNNVLIGKNGKNMDALSVIVRQAIYLELGRYYNFNLDIGEYKVKQQRNLESFAKQIARDVYKSKVEAKLDPMNSYERRIIHNILNDDKRVSTSSVGEEPNRCIVVKPKEE